MALRFSDSPVFNVCTGIPTSVGTLAHLVAELTGKSPRIDYLPPRAGEIRHSLGAPEAADAALGTEGRMPLREGLGDVLAWMSEAAA